MAYFEDLQPCTLFPGEWRKLLAVGWLQKGKPFTTGPVDRELLRLLRHHWSWQPPNPPRGMRKCDFCSMSMDGNAHFVLGDDVLYVAPALLAHYIGEHQYAPPAQFVSAFMTAMNGPNRMSLESTTALSRHLIAPYDAASIAVLEGIQAVRRRPGMYIGSMSSPGLEHMLMEVVGNSLDQHLAGFVSRIEVQVDDLGWVTVEDDGQGISVDNHPHAPGLTVLEVALTKLHAGATLDGHHPHVHITSSNVGVGISVVSALSTRLEVESRRSGLAYRAAFEAGTMVEPPHSVGETKKRGTVIRYLTDLSLFQAGTHLDLERVELRFLEIAGLCPKLDLRLQGRSLRRPEGLPGWVHELAPDAVKETALSAFGTVDHVEVEVALAWSPSGKEPLIRSFVNYQETSKAGSHTEGLLAAVQEASVERKMKKKVLAGLVAVVHVGMLHPDFKGPTRAALEVDAARAAVAEVVKRAIDAAPWWWDRLHEVMK